MTVLAWSLVAADVTQPGRGAGDGLLCSHMRALCHVPLCYMLWSGKFLRALVSQLTQIQYAPPFDSLSCLVCCAIIHCLRVLFVLCRHHLGVAKQQLQQP